MPAPAPTPLQPSHQKDDTELTMSDSLSGETYVKSPRRDGTLDSAISTGSFLDDDSIPEDRNVLPPKHPYRTLVLCFDGTGDQFDLDNSNIVTFFSMLKKDDRSQQMVYYQAGIGTYTTPQTATPLKAKISKALDEAIAWNLQAHVMGGYEFLMQNYTAGDRICIFGFSRGAYTARSLAGMVNKVGILPACNHQQVPFAYKMFTTTDEVGWKQSNAFKKTFSIDVDIEFIGVWDTVNSVGLIPKRLPFTTSNTAVRTFRHAVSLDERRAKFKANHWARASKEEEERGVKCYNQDHNHDDHDDHHGKSGHAKRGKGNGQRALERRYGKDRTQETDVDEVWFAGCHCDVGGGSVPNETTTNLARIPLRWMIRECFKTNTGIMFSREGLEAVGLNPDSLYPFVRPRPAAVPLGDNRIESIPRAPATVKASSVASTAIVPVKPNLTEEELDLKDALAPIYDQLSLRWVWWLLEFLPLKQKFQKSDNSWGSIFGWNLGRGRFVPKQKKMGARVHRSVKVRMEAKDEHGKKYVPKANLNLEHVTWVD
ncbi:hypothetical protein K435DRAFT_973673 [Dendrothele bispora CBS 962.96]|uniref:T6SS Phospholipase effector Tle1-like catalytic domain-containing protein n=1 Tax=Dendrothele bispora (strain CBS 962.96) TaxID=1314807 RepID=A0A4S8KQS6_DENBC|nr:hypothetical protein K435DRAFT_973673 [Dendrothele bispora CBS 962.96]